MNRIGIWIFRYLFSLLADTPPRPDVLPHLHFYSITNNLPNQCQPAQSDQASTSATQDRPIQCLLPRPLNGPCPCKTPAVAELQHLLDAKNPSRTNELAADLELSKAAAPACSPQQILATSRAKPPVYMKPQPHPKPSSEQPNTLAPSWNYLLAAHITSPPRQTITSTTTIATEADHPPIDKLHHQCAKK